MIIVVFFEATAVSAFLKKLQRIKNRAARILFYASNEDDVHKLFQAGGENLVIKG